MTTPTDVLKMIKEKEVKYVDFRFCDTRGKEQHVTVPAKTGEGRPLHRRQDVRRLLDRRLEGHQRVRHDPDAGCGHRRSSIRSSKRPRSTCAATSSSPPPCRATSAIRVRSAERAEAYLKSTGIADGALFGPENEFFIFDNVKWHTDMNGTGYTIDSYDAAPGTRAREFTDRRQHRPSSRA